jgi:hypothetical protein
MSVTDYIWTAAGKPLTDTVEKKVGTCAFCGFESSHSAPVKKAVSANFNNWDLMVYAGSERVCPACAWCFKAKELRHNNFIAHGTGLILFKRDGIENHLFNPPAPPFVFCITRSHKKHNAFRGIISNSRQEYYIREEDKLYLFQAEKMRPVFEIMNDVYTQGSFTKTDLATGNYNMARIWKYGPERWEKLEGALKSLRPNPAFELVVYALNKEGKEDAK